jgi:uncharacterized protein with PIN domain
VSQAKPFQIRLRFHGDLDVFLGRDNAGIGEVLRQLAEPTSVKDVIESCGVPHPEVDRILAENQPVNFAHVLRSDIALDVYPVDLNQLPGRPLQQRHVTTFVADGHLGKLVRNLRLLGVDVAYSPTATDRELLHVMETQRRALLTRDRRLLMHRVVEDAYCPRSSEPLQQTIEVIRRFDLARSFQPFTRCMNCNGVLVTVDKASVIEQLEPLTRIYYDEFRQCPLCARIFWRGSHFGRLETLIRAVRERLST